MNTLDELQDRIAQRVAPAMQAHYMARLASLVSTRAAADAWRAFERRLRIAEHLSAGLHHGPATRQR